MLTESTVKAVAQRLDQAHQARKRYTPLDNALRSEPLDEAYRIQEALVERWIPSLGPVFGYKIALTSKPMQAMVGVEQPLSGQILAGRVHRCTGSQPVVLSMGNFQRLGVEFEVAVELARPLRGAGHDRDSVAASVSACYPALELIEDRNADYQQIDAFSLVADNCWNGGIVLGEPVHDLSGIDFVDGATELFIDTQAVGSGRIGDALGHPFAAVAWLADLLHTQGRSLQAGQIVMTGSSITTRFPSAGDSLMFRIDSLGEVQIQLVP